MDLHYLGVENPRVAGVLSRRGARGTSEPRQTQTAIENEARLIR